MRIFVTGASGQIARALVEAAESQAGVILACGARPRLDLAEPDSILPVMGAFAPDLVVNCAAYTAVDKAESEPELAFAVNRDGAGAVAAAAARLGAPVIQLSSDYVFDGAKSGAYVEDDTTAPTCVYGRSKWAGEQAAEAANAKHIILRTSWVYAPYGQNFVQTMIRLSRDRPRLTVVDDQIGCPTYAPDIAIAILAIAQRLDAEGWRPGYAGVTHLAGPDAITWCGFARAIIDGSAARGGSRPPVDAISTADYPTPARRPANSRLACDRLAALFDQRLPPLATSLAACLDRVIGPGARG